MYYLPRKNRGRITCQKNQKNFEALPVYREFLENVSELQTPDDMPVDLTFAEVSAQFYLTRIRVGITRVIKSLLNPLRPNPGRRRKLT